MNEPLLSVVCIVYNHEKYLRDCLDGIIGQKTNFHYEIIVHDDASTDGSAFIISEYCKNYPDLFVPILQTENQYSKGVRIGRDIIKPLIRGKYVAICEGDDYWCDDNKLQRQFDYLEEHPDFVACVHNTRVINCKTGETYIKIKNALDGELKTEDVLRNTVNEFHTSSVVCRTPYYTVPKSFDLSYCGDASRALYWALSGRIYRFSDVMSVYRLFSVGSYTERTSNDSIESVISKLQEGIPLFEHCDRMSNYRYHALFQERIDDTHYTILIMKKEYKKAFIQYQNVIKTKPLFERVKIMVDAFFPLLGRCYRRFKNGH